MSTNTNTLSQLIEGVYKHGPDILEWCNTDADLSVYMDRVAQEKLDYPIPASNIDNTNWIIPQRYKEFDVEKYCLDLCNTKEEIARVVLEIDLYKKHNMIEVLQCMKYIVDTLRKNNVVWGVGRGSSVSSYCLFLLGVHKIDSLKYDLPLEEFFK